MNNISPCTIGVNNSDACHLTTYTKRLSCKQGLKSAADLCEDERELILYRSGVTSFNESDTVCLHHEVYFLKEFRKKFKKCLDSFSIHGASKPSANREINLPLAKILIKNGFSVKPGQKLCKRCHTAAKRYEYDEIDENEDHSDGDTQIADLDVSLHQEEVKSKVAEKLETLEQSPLVLHSKKELRRLKL